MIDHSTAIRQERFTSPVPLAVIACAVLEDEIAHFSREFPQIRHIEMMEQGLHNEPEKLRGKLQEAIDRVETAHPDVQAIVLGYGLCSRGTEGIRTSKALLVVPRAHDCITLLLGDKQRYAQYVKQNPGTYWYSPGWNRHHTPPGKDRYDKLLAQYIEKYGEDNAQFLMESEQQWFSTYNRATYVDLGVGVTKEDLAYTQACANWLKWGYDHQQGDPHLFRQLLGGDWSERDFLVLQPGESLRMTADERVIELSVSAKPVNP